MDPKPPGLLLLLLIIGAASAAELVQYGQCSLNFTDGKIINLRKSKELGGAVFLSSFSSDSLEDCSHSCCNDTAGQCSVAVYHNDKNMDNCYHINCPNPQTCVYQDLAGYTLAIISRGIPQAEALGGTATEKPAVTTKTASTKSLEVNVIPQERVFPEKQEETTTTKLTTEQPSTAAQQETTAAEQPGTGQKISATEQSNPGSEQHTTEQPVPGTHRQTDKPNPASTQQQQQTSTKLTTITRTTTTPKPLATHTFTQKQTTKTTTTTVDGKTATKVHKIVPTTQASKTSELAAQEVKQTTPTTVPTQKPTTKVPTVTPTNPPPTEKPSPSPVPSTKPSATSSRKTQAVTVNTNPSPEATSAQTKASSTGKSPDVTAADTQPHTTPTSKPAAATTKQLMPGNTSKDDQALTQASLVPQGSLGPQVAHRNESMSAANKLGKSSYGSLIVAMCFGLLFLFAVVVVVGKRWYESWQRRHYSKIDYLINGMYN
ncbi:MANSC4 [Branchiostoma lanceolatum]|uniref:MANSC4 protein n=1 Tax=Branchiostoma lanceolatum TaxID=7740 RepID=A0A8K0EGU5_BRALA|nr:MANSC4 [Branchiostoma lanceolatum]